MTDTALASAARIAALAEAAGAVAGSLDLEETLRAIVVAGRAVTGARYAALGVLGPDRRIARFITSGMDAETVQRLGDPPTGHGILGAVIDDARPLRLGDLGADSRSIGFPQHHPAMTSFLGAPVRARGEVFGNLYLTEAPGEVFSEEDEQMVTALADLAGVAVQNARLFGEARAQAEEARRSLTARASITHMAEAVLRARDVDQVLSELALHARALVDARAVAVGVPTEAGGVHFPFTAGEARGVPDAGAGSLPSMVLRACESTQADDSSGALPMGAHDLLAIPVALDGQAHAVLLAADPHGGSGFRADDHEALAALAALGAIAFVSAERFARERSQAGALAELRTSEAAREARRESTLRAVSTQEHERRRIAQDLHDRTAGALATLLFGLRRIEREAGDADLSARAADMRSDVQSAIADLRDLIADLRPRVLDDLGLEPALARLAGTAGRRGDLAVDTTFEGLDGVPAELATVVYRIAQEALANALRHSGATRVHLSAACVDGRLELVIEDNGVGRGSAPASYGVDGMTERAALAGGKLRFSAPADGGTRVSFEARP